MVQLGEAIDFRKLLKEERRRARRKAREEKANKERQSAPTETTSANDETTIPRQQQQQQQQETNPTPSWNSTTEQLHLSNLDRTRECLCTDPPNIFYRQRCLPRVYCQDLWKWLQALPMASVESKPHKNNQAPTGCWNWLPHAQRHVALFYTSTNLKKKHDTTTQEESVESTNTTFPKPLQLLVDALVQAHVFDKFLTPNHILVNRYTPEQGIVPHTDGPAYVSRTAIMSLGEGQVLMQFAPRPTTSKTTTTSDCPRATTLQQQILLHGGGSLVVFEDQAYLDYMHSIQELPPDSRNVEFAASHCRNAVAGTKVERRERISLTIRHCLPEAL